MCVWGVRQKDCEFEAKMDYEVRPIQKKFKKKKRRGRDLVSEWEGLVFRVRN